MCIIFFIPPNISPYFVFQYPNVTSRQVSSLLLGQACVPRDSAKVIRMLTCCHRYQLAAAISPLNRRHVDPDCGLRGKNHGSIETGKPPRLPNNLVKFSSHRKARNESYPLLASDAGNRREMLASQAADGESQSNVREKRNHDQYR